MHSPEFYLKELLYDFDCVTIPGLGGFIMHANHAKLDSSRHKIYPPARYPSFNSLLKHDDGLLISRIASLNNISYSDASAIVRDFAGKLEQRISGGETIILEGIGELKKGTEGSIIFDPVRQANFHPEAFGLEPLNIYPVARQIQPSGNAIMRVDRKASQFREKRPASVKWTLALSVPVILFLLYGIIFPASVQEIYTNYSGIVVDWLRVEKAAPAYVRETNKIKAFVPEAETPAEIIPAPVITGTSDIKAEPETITLSAIPASPKYYIIGGCFEKEENAERFLSSLISKGFDAEKAGITKKGHLRISYKSFSEKAPALSYLQKIKTEENEGAWLLKY